MKFLGANFSGSIEISGSLHIPYGNKNQRPSNPESGSLFLEISDSGSNVIIYNGQSGSGWEYAGGQGNALRRTFAPIQADIEYLVVAGGGAGGYNAGGGGGAGGLLSSSLSSVESGSSFTITVGGGAAVNTGGQGDNGSDSSIAGSTITTITATGGGGGGGREPSEYAGADGGSGGGASADSTSIGGGSGTVGQGNDGGGTTANANPGGGGGAGAAGITSGNGGDGLQSSITGTSTYYAGGGGIGYSVAITNGGQGGGGDGINASDSSAAATRAGDVNTGGGGAGGYNSSGKKNGGSGGSGVVILAYDSGSINGVGGIVGDAGSNRKYHQFNTTGTFKVGSTSDFGIVTDGLVTHYDAGDFASRGSSTWTDLEGSLNATVTGATLGQDFYYTFDGSNDEMQVAAASDTTFNLYTFSIEIWIKPVTGNNNDGTFVFNYGHPSGAPYYSMAIALESQSSREYITYLSNNAGSWPGSNLATDVGSLDLGSWNHFVFVRDANTSMAFYKNGSSIKTGTPSGTPNFYTEEVYLGKRGYSNSNRFEGDLAQFRFYNKVLSASEVLQNYNATKTNFV